MLSFRKSQPVCIPRAESSPWFCFSFCTKARSDVTGRGLQGCRKKPLSRGDDPTGSPAARPARLGLGTLPVEPEPEADLHGGRLVAGVLGSPRSCFPATAYHLLPLAGEGVEGQTEARRARPCDGTHLSDRTGAQLSLICVCGCVGGWVGACSA